MDRRTALVSGLNAPLPLQPTPQPHVQWSSHPAPQHLTEEIDDPYAHVPHLDTSNLGTSYIKKAEEYRALQDFIKLLDERARYFESQCYDGMEGKELYDRFVIDTGALLMKAHAWTRDVKAPLRDDKSAQVSWQMTFNALFEAYERGRSAGEGGI